MAIHPPNKLRGFLAKISIKKIWKKQLMTLNVESQKLKGKLVDLR